MAFAEPSTNGLPSSARAAVDTRDPQNRVGSEVSRPSYNDVEAACRG